MKKTTVILFALAAVFAATSAFLAFRNSDFEAENSALKQELTKQKEIKEQIYDLTAKNKAAEAELSLRKDKNRALEDSLTEANERNEALAKDLETAERNAAEQQKLAAEKDAEAQNARNASETDKATIEELRKKLAEETERAETLNGEVARLRSAQDRKDLEDKIAEKDAVIAEKDKLIGDLTKERDALDDELATRKLEIADMQQRMDAEIATGRDRADAADAGNEELRAKLQAAEEKIAKLENTIRTLRRRAANNS